MNRPIPTGAAGRGDGALLSHSLLLGERLYFFARLRFLAAAGILIGALFAVHVVGIEGLRLGELIAVTIFLALCNTLIFLVVRPLRQPERASAAYRRMTTWC